MIVKRPRVMTMRRAPALCTVTSSDGGMLRAYCGLKCDGVDGFHRSGFELSIPT